jgi:tetratricopeptide (TPR) repeat protein
MTSRWLGIFLVIVAPAQLARADGPKLAGACVTPVPPASPDGSPTTPRVLDPMDLDGDGKPDVIVGDDNGGDGRGNRPYNAYVMRGACGYLVGFGDDNAFDGNFKVLPAMHGGLHDLNASSLGIHDFNSFHITFAGTKYVTSDAGSAPRGGVDPDAVDPHVTAEAAYKAAMRKARKLENAGDHEGAVAAFQEALSAGSADNVTLAGDEEPEAELALGASALGAHMLDLAEAQTRQGLYVLQFPSTAGRTKIIAMGWFNLGMISEAEGDTTNAVDAYQQSVHFNPTKAASQRLAAARAAVATTDVAGKGLPALSADGTTLALRIGGGATPLQVAFAPAGAGVRADQLVALSAANLAGVNEQLAAGKFRTIASRRLTDADGATSLTSLGLVVRLDVPKAGARGMWAGMDQLELAPPAGGKLYFAGVPASLSAVTGVALVRTPTSAFLYVELAGRTLVITPLALPASAKK